MNSVIMPSLPLGINDQMKSSMFFFFKNCIIIVVFLFTFYVHWYLQLESTLNHCVMWSSDFSKYTQINLAARLDDSLDAHVISIQFALLLTNSYAVWSTETLLFCFHIQLLTLTYIHVHIIILSACDSYLCHVTISLVGHACGRNVVSWLYTRWHNANTTLQACSVAVVLLWHVVYGSLPLVDAIFDKLWTYV